MRFVDVIKESFYALENRENAQWMGRYMRHKYLFIGIKTPERAVVFKDIYKKYGKAEDWYEVSSELFAMPEREFQYVAMEYLLKAKKSWDPRVPLLIQGAAYVGLCEGVKSHLEMRLHTGGEATQPTVTDPVGYQW